MLVSKVCGYVRDAMAKKFQLVIEFVSREY